MKLIVKLSVLALLFFAITGCSQEEIQEETPAPQNQVVEYSIIGKWMFTDVDSGVSHTAYYTFYDNQTMLVEDMNDIFDGEIISYSYNSSTMVLTLWILPQTIQWNSANQFEVLVGSQEGKVFTRVN